MGELKLDSTEHDINQIKDAFDSEGIKPSGLLCYNECGSDEPSSWDKMKESILKHLDIATKLGSPSIRIFGGYPGKSVNLEEYTNRTAEAVSKALMKDSSRVSVLIQNHYGSYSVKEALELIRKTGSDRFGLVF
jgi:sugar phosphate isomerase/epimerase